VTRLWKACDRHPSYLVLALAADLGAAVAVALNLWRAA